ncbi:amino acid adenylation domain-containing protein, partial [Rapidithrix thailandica]
MDKKNIENTPITFPLSEGQEALWVAQQMNPGSYAYTIPLAYWLSKDTDLKVLKSAFQKVLQKHKILAARIGLEDGRPVHVFERGEEIPFTITDVHHQSDAELLSMVSQDSKEPFDLEKDSLINVKVYKRKDGQHILLILVHHLVFDGVSVNILLEDLLTFYYGQNEKSLPTPFREYVEWQQNMLNGPEGNRLEEFWKLQALEQLDPLVLPVSTTNGSRKPEGEVFAINVDADLVRELRILAKHSGSTDFALLLSFYYLLLNKYSGLTSMAVGIPMIGRPGMKFEQTVGCFINMVALRGDLPAGSSFQNLLEQVSDRVFEAYDHSQYPLYTFKKALKANGHSTNLFSTAFYYQKIEALQVKDIDGILGKRIENIRQVGEFDLTLEVVEHPEGTFELFFKYNSNLYQAGFIRQFANHFIALLKNMLPNPEQHLNAINLETSINNNDGPSVAEALSLPNTVDLIQKQAEKHPDKIAVVCEGNTLTYQELIEKSKKISRYLSSRNIQGTLIGVFVERNENLLPIFMGILASGNAFVPLDPVYPKERLAHMLKGSVSWVLSNESLKALLPEEDFSTLIYSEILQEKVEEIPLPDILPGDPAYVIFTSGSTGKPKGVAISHNSLSNFLLSMQKRPGITSSDKLLAVTTVCFDIAYLELFLPLLVGGTLEIATNAITKDGILLKERLDKGDISVMQATPSTWKMLLAAEWDGASAFKVLCGGEALSKELANALLERSDSVWNMYGPTEATIWASVAKVESGKSIVLGKPVDHMEMLILHETGGVCPIGVPGEIYIGGTGLAIGYLNRPEETAARFVNVKVGNTLKRLYKTGDLGRYTESGEVEYLGRIDQQIKLKGHRIELEEIELSLQKMRGVTDAIVVKRESRLVAFLKSNKDKVLSERELSENLKTTLPGYMVPSTYYWVTGYPLTLNKKIDRKSLEQKALTELPVISNNDKQSPASRNISQPNAERESVEQFLIEAIKEIQLLDTEQVSRSRNIGEFGFDSIGYTTLGVKISKHFHKKVTPALFFEYRTIEEIASYLLGVNHGDSRKSGKEEIHSFQKENKSPSHDEPIAIIGMAGKYPQADSLQEFWDKLEANENLITEVPSSRWNWRKYFGDVHKERNKTNSKWGGFLNQVDKFDAFFFGISPREAELMDPLQRIMLEMTWHTFEDAGYKPSDLAGSDTGVFIGCVSSDYTELILNSGCEIVPHTVSGMAKTMVANRISFMLDLRGPSVVIDTACSSSLVAVHEALEAIRCGHCKVALAGGVNVMLSPFGHIALSKNEMLSPDGSCKAFDASANGYVRGEGAGLILLKRLSDAQQDGDHIYAVIRGSSENHGGRTNSLTAPNPNAQADLIVEAMQKAKIHPSTISYMEAHGTGTALGDPIEVNGLKQAFQRFINNDKSENKQVAYCGIGSVKTNIGHLEGAAGIAGLQRIVLSMQQQKLTANVQLKEVNPYIDLDNSPFYLVQHSKEWKRLQDDKGSEIPRRAGVSSFGFGGVNAHVVLEEYTENLASKANAVNNKYLIVLSAKTENQLKKKATQLRDYLINKGKKHSLADIAYTLQRGREAMKERLAFVVENQEEALAKLSSIVESNSDSEVYRGSVKKQTGNNSLVEGLLEEEGFQEILLQRLSSKGNLKGLAKLWVNGVELAFEELYDDKPHRLPLPVYPFEAVRYWLPVDKPEGSLIDLMVPNNEFNTSVFEKTLSNQEPLVKDHVVNGKYVFPGVGSLEMVYEAVSKLKKGPFSLSKVYWLKPLVIDQEVKVKVVLKLRDTHYDFEVLDSDDELCTTGSIQLLDVGPQESLPIDGLLSGQKIDFDRFYRNMQDKGVYYGAYYQVVRSVRVNGSEAMAVMKVSADFEHETSCFYLSPALMDGALQTVATLMMHLEADSGLKVPFSVGQVEFFAKPKASCYAYATKSNDEKYHVAILDQNGKVCIKLYDVVNRTMNKNEMTAPSHYHHVKWEQVSLEGNKVYHRDVNRLYIHTASNKAEAKSLTGILSGGVSFLSLEEILNENAETGSSAISGILKEKGLIHEIIYLGGFQTAPVNLEDTEQGTIQAEQSVRGLFRVMKFLAKQKLLDEKLTVCIITNDTCAVTGGEKIQAFNGGLLGLVQTLNEEYPKSCIRHLDLSLSGSEIASESKYIKELIPQLRKMPVLMTLRRGQVYRRSLYPLHLPSGRASKFEAGKVYLILGGAGGLGRVLSDHLSRKHPVKLIWIGRSELNAGQQALMRTIESRGSEVTYLQGDIGEASSAASLFARARAAYGSIHGVIHSALELRDKRLEQLEEADLLAVLAPKVQGSVYFYQQLREEPLDFVLFFSSLNAYVGSPGQSNYASACTFQDSYAEALRSELSCPVQVINWSYWSESGIVSTEYYRDLLESLGLYGIRNGEGLQAIEEVLSSRVSNVVMVKSRGRLLEKFGFHDQPEHLLQAVQQPVSVKGLVPGVSSSQAGFERLREGFEELLSWSGRLLLYSFQQMGVFHRGGEEYELESLRERLGIVPGYFRLFPALLDILSQSGYLLQEGESIITREGIGLEDREVLEREGQTLSGLQESLSAYVRLVWECVIRYPSILRGEESAVSVMFPEGDKSLVEGIYRGNALVDHYNELVAGLVREYAEQRGRSERLQILEVGAGTGGTSKFVLEALRNWGGPVRYHYTDISASFTNYGKETYLPEYPFMEFSL